MDEQAEVLDLIETEIEQPEGGDLDLSGQEIDQSDAEDSELEQTEVEEELFETIEYGDKEYQVPKELKDAFLRQDDYTRKTQEVSEARKQLEQRQQIFEQQMQVREQHLQDYANLAYLDDQLAYMQNQNWQEKSEQDPVAAQQEFFQLNQIQQQRQQLAQQIAQKEQQAFQQQQQEIAMLREQSSNTLKQKIQGWNDGLANQVFNSSMDNYGFNQQIVEIASVNPGVAEALHDAYRYREMMNKAKHKQKQPVKPVRPLKGKGTVKRDESKMSTEEWIAMRNKKQYGY